MKREDRLLAFRLLRNRGECDVDAFFARTPFRVWEEYKVANAIIESYDAWLESVRHGNKRKWQPPEFKALVKGKRRRLNGETY